MQLNTVLKGIQVSNEKKGFLALQTGKGFLLKTRLWLNTGTIEGPTLQL
jgi:hypothetical protein